jgi:hypothetical protein
MPRSAKSYRIHYKKYEVARVIVSGDGSGDLDCSMRDDDGVRVASDLRSSDLCVLSWRAKRSGYYHLRVSNLDRKANLFTVRVLGRPGEGWAVTTPPPGHRHSTVRTYPNLYSRKAAEIPRGTRILILGNGPKHFKRVMWTSYGATRFGWMHRDVISSI